MLNRYLDSWESAGFGFDHAYSTLLFASPTRNACVVTDCFFFFFFFNEKVRRSNNVYNSLCLVSPYCLPGTGPHALHVHVLEAGTAVTLILQLRGTKVVIGPGLPI